MGLWDGFPGYSLGTAEDMSSWKGVTYPWEAASLLSFRIAASEADVPCRGTAVIWVSRCGVNSLSTRKIIFSLWMQLSDFCEGEKLLALLSSLKVWPGSEVEACPLAGRCRAVLEKWDSWSQAVFVQCKEGTSKIVGSWLLTYQSCSIIWISF